MKTIVIPAILIVLGLFIAQYFFGLDIEKLVKGSIDFITTILHGPAQ